MDSTKKMVRKLAGHASGTAACVTNVGNERGEALMSVLTAGEGAGIISMAEGLMKRYREAGVTPPVAIYVDRGCCSATQKSSTSCSQLPTEKILSNVGKTVAGRNPDDSGYDTEEWENEDVAQAQPADPAEEWREQNEAFGRLERIWTDVSRPLYERAWARHQWVRLHVLFHREAELAYYDGL